MRGSVTVQMAASPDVVWDLVSDVTRIGEFSPETFEAVWLGDATGPVAGARFKGHVKRNGVGPIYWTVCEVLDAKPLERFEFAVVIKDEKVNTWCYELVAKDGGTAVTESYSLQPNPITRAYWALLGRRRGKTNERGMRQTLERIKAIAEAA
ncbi:SRPBCC family protein [Nocardioides marmoriginsengisoli]|uniref:SRPBCC family protein n=1 Tax=Nocardioides marmoriginsengisoli TaxID=661483 RepID=A0A3N0CQX8_9ACTN|nr:SRPBCC family protein [Nocardioides marmoriginsengisoli]RNL65739.1 SRPBCC family protein [Nocardioides marmoriginsengisoli]